MNSFYKGDYVRFNALKAVVSATITFVLIVAVVIVYKIDYILANVFKIDYKIMGFALGILYVVWIFVYWLIARIMYARSYENARSNIIIYNHCLKKLQEAKQKEVVKARGGIVIDDDFIDF